MLRSNCVLPCIVRLRAIALPLPVLLKPGEAGMMSTVPLGLVEVDWGVGGLMASL